MTNEVTPPVESARVTELRESLAAHNALIRSGTLPSGGSGFANAPAQTKEHRHVSNAEFMASRQTGEPTTRAPAAPPNQADMLGDRYRAQVSGYQRKCAAAGVQPDQMVLKQFRKEYEAILRDMGGQDVSKVVDKIVADKEKAADLWTANADAKTGLTPLASLPAEVLHGYTLPNGVTHLDREGSDFLGRLRREGKTQAQVDKIVAAYVETI